MSKILLYLEPHPIRNSFVMFKSIIEHFIGAYQADKNDDLLIYGNLETLAHIATVYPDFKAKMIFPTKKEDKFFHQNNYVWDEKGIDVWQRLMVGENAQCSEYVDIIKSIYKRQAFDYIVCWGTNCAVKQAAGELGIGFVNMELGCSRKPYIDTLVADPWCVNGSAVLAQADIADLENIKSSVAEDDLLQYGDCFGSAAYEADFEYIPKTMLDLINADKKIAFIPLQLYDDANLLRYSKYNEVADVLKDVLPKLNAAGYLCVIKEHPASCLRKGSEEANTKARDFAEQYDNVIWLDKKYKGIANAFLFRYSDVIVTVNSSTGFEALFYNKPVIVLGEAVYKISNVFPELSDYLSEKFDYAQYVVNIGKIRNFFLKYYLIPRTRINCFENFVSYVQFVGDMSRQNLSVSEIIQRYVRYREQN